MNELNFPKKEREESGKVDHYGADMMKHLQMKTESEYKATQDFDGYVAFDPDFCEKYAHIPKKIQNAVITKLYKLGKIDGKRGEYGEVLLKVIPEVQKRKAKPLNPHLQAMEDAWKILAEKELPVYYHNDSNAKRIARSQQNHPEYWTEYFEKYGHINAASEYAEEEYGEYE